MKHNHPDSLLLMNRKEGSRQHFLESIEEAYCLVKEMLFVSVFPPRRFGAMTSSVMSSLFFGGTI
jgi:hypothetical protein